MTRPAIGDITGLSMRGAPARAIQELAGHADLTMTQRYMHLGPAALDAAIQVLDRPGFSQKFGDGVETGPSDQEKINESGMNRVPFLRQG